jgi:hypothetical protein
MFGQDTEIGTRFVLVRVISWIAFLNKSERFNEPRSSTRLDLLNFASGQATRFVISQIALHWLQAK